MARAYRRLLEDVGAQEALVAARAARVVAARRPARLDRSAGGSELTPYRVSVYLRIMTTPGAVLDALGDPTRRAVFERVLRGPIAAGAIAEGLPVSRPAVSQHLGVLRQAGLVVDHAIGRQRIYEVVPDAIVQMRDYFDAFWDQALASFRDAAEQGGTR
ncbi:MAG TPA: metalloregulator ArsR/SmtB family transcription factor [Acidimicrobiales bacterium]|nr:metalloregulator ArsR/SmtB family transcription factor [Acidimicrobiales bacterium]